MSKEVKPLMEYVEHLAQTAGPNSVPAYILRNGRQFKSQPLTEPERLYVKRIQWGKRRPKQCYKNCQQEAMALPAAEGITLKYVEGYLSPGIGFGVDHAWLSINGKVIDPTVRTNEKPAHNVGTITNGWEYFGVEMEPSECFHVLKHMKFIPIIDDWECRWPMLKRERKAVEAAAVS